MTLNEIKELLHKRVDEIAEVLEDKDDVKKVDFLKGGLFEMEELIEALLDWGWGYEEELREYMRRKGFNEEAINNFIEMLEELR